MIITTITMMISKTILGKRSPSPCAVWLAECLGGATESLRLVLHGLSGRRGGGGGGRGGRKGGGVGQLRDGPCQGNIPNLPTSQCSVQQYRLGFDIYLLERTDVISTLSLYHWIHHYRGAIQKPQVQQFWCIGPTINMWCLVRWIYILFVSPVKDGLGRFDQDWKNLLLLGFLLLLLLLLLLL